REPEDGNCPLDGCWIALDFHEIVHARIALEANGRAMKLVLPDRAIDLHCNDEPEALENLRERARIAADIGDYLLPLLVCPSEQRRAFPIDRRTHCLSVFSIDAKAQHMVDCRQAEIGTIISPI